MKYRQLGKSGLKASVIGLGTGQFGARAWGYGVRYTDKDIMKIIEAAIEYGINLFDTSEIYGDGLSETLLGKAIKEYGRDNFIIITKVAPWNLRYKNVIKAALRSLRRMSIDLIDLYLIHHPNFLIPMKETFRALEDLVRIGVVRYVGVSNFTKPLLTMAQEYFSHTEIVANEIEYNILSYKAEKDIIPYCREHGISVIAYSPLAGGVLTGNYSLEKPPNDRARAFNFYAKRRFLRKTQPLLNLLRDIAEQKHATIAQISLSYIIRDPVCIAIPAALNEQQVKENAESCRITLTKDDIIKIKKLAITVDPITYAFDHYVIRPISWTKEFLRHAFILQR